MYVSLGANEKMPTNNVHKIGAPFAKIHIKKGAPARPSFSGWLPKLGVENQATKAACHVILTGQLMHQIGALGS